MSFREARRIVERGRDALGGSEAVVAAGGLALDGEGALDLGTLLQGRTPFEGDRHPIQERLAVLPATDRLVYELRAPLNPDAMEWRRTDFRQDGTYRMNLARGRAVWTPPASRLRVERTIPHFLLDEVLARPSGLRYLGRVRIDGHDRDAVTWAPLDRGLVTLLFEPTSGLLRQVQSLADVPVRGDAEVRWTFLEYDSIPGLGPFPAGYMIHIDDELLQEVRWIRRSASPEGGILDAPEGVVLPEPAPFPQGAVGGSAPGDGPPSPQSEEFDIRELADGVYLLVNLRLGFHMLFVEFDDYVVAVDAPAGWWELLELPPRNWARLTSPELGERYVAAIRSRVDDKPIRFVVLTHPHGDHVGGIRAFVEAGATILGADITRPVAERTLAGTLQIAGGSYGTTPPLEFQAVEGRHIIGDDSLRMEVLDVGANPHAEGMLAVWLPEARILYVSDLFEPWGSQGVPSAQRMPVMRWFVEWLEDADIEPERIYSIHGSALVTEEHLTTIRGMGESGNGGGG